MKDCILKVNHTTLIVKKGIIMHVTIKNYEAKEAEQVEKLLQLCNEDRSLLNVLSSPGLQFAYSAIYDNELIGIAFAW